MPRAVMHSMVKGSRNVDIEENEVNNDANVSAPRYQQWLDMYMIT